MIGYADGSSNSRSAQRKYAGDPQQGYEARNGCAQACARYGISIPSPQA